MITLLVYTPGGDRRILEQELAVDRRAGWVPAAIEPDGPDWCRLVMVRVLA